MTFMDVLTPSITPDLSKAKLVRGKASAQPHQPKSRTPDVPLTISILEELKDYQATAPEVATCIEANMKSISSTLSMLKARGLVSSVFIRSPVNQQVALYSITEAGIKHLNGWRTHAKPLPPVSGSESKPVLESLHVVTQEEIPQFVQSNN